MPRLYVRGDTKERILSKSIVAANGCRVWTGKLTKKGYAVVWHEGKQDYAHRVAYRLYIGPIPDGMDVMHTCHNPASCPGGDKCEHRRCVHENHLKAAFPVDIAANTCNRNSEKTHCSNGHEYAEHNTYQYSGKRAGRMCVQCGIDRRLSEVRGNRDRIREYLSSHPCVDCGESDHMVLEFDHVRGNKLATVSALRGRMAKWSRIEEEISKCEVRCANCHRRKTVAQLGWYM